MIDTTEVEDGDKQAIVTKGLMNKQHADTKEEDHHDDVVQSSIDHKVNNNDDDDDRREEEVGQTDTGDHEVVTIIEEIEIIDESDGDADAVANTTKNNNTFKDQMRKSFLKFDEQLLLVNAKSRRDNGEEYYVEEEIIIEEEEIHTTDTTTKTDSMEMTNNNNNTEEVMMDQEAVVNKEESSSNDKSDDAHEEYYVEETVIEEDSIFEHTDINTETDITTTEIMTKNDTKEAMEQELVVHKESSSNDESNNTAKKISSPSADSSKMKENFQSEMQKSFAAFDAVLAHDEFVVLDENIIDDDDDDGEIRGEEETLEEFHNEMKKSFTAFESLLLLQKKKQQSQQQEDDKDEKDVDSNNEAATVDDEYTVEEEIVDHEVKAAGQDDDEFAKEMKKSFMAFESLLKQNISKEEEDKSTSFKEEEEDDDDEKSEWEEETVQESIQGAGSIATFASADNKTSPVTPAHPIAANSNAPPSLEAAPPAPALPQTPNRSNASSTISANKKDFEQQSDKTDEEDATPTIVVGEEEPHPITAYNNSTPSSEATIPFPQAASANESNNATGSNKASEQQSGKTYKDATPTIVVGEEPHPITAYNNSTPSSEATTPLPQASANESNAIGSNKASEQQSDKTDEEDATPTIVVGEEEPHPITAYHNSTPSSEATISLPQAPANESNATGSYKKASEQQLGKTEEEDVISIEAPTPIEAPTRTSISGMKPYDDDTAIIMVLEEEDVEVDEKSPLLAKPSRLSKEATPNYSQPQQHLSFITARPLFQTFLILLTVIIVSKAVLA